MRNGVLSRLRSRFLALNAEGLPVTAERFPAENELVGAATCFERGIESLEIKNRKEKIREVCIAILPGCGHSAKWIKNSSPVSIPSW